MGSSPTTEPLVDGDESSESIDADANRDASAESGGGEPFVPARTRTVLRIPEGSPPRHSPVVLVVDVVRMLRGCGLGIVESTAYGGEALRASADLLRCIGVMPDHFAPRHVEADGPVLIAAATLMRAAGIEPNDVVVWPGQRS
jgi:hypothetical protein